jgi:hypothetical protein
MRKHPLADHILTFDIKFYILDTFLPSGDVPFTITDLTNGASGVTGDITL